MNKSDKVFSRLVKCAEARVLRAESRNLSKEEKSRRQVWRQAQYDAPRNAGFVHHQTYLERHPEPSKDSKPEESNSRTPSAVAAMAMVAGFAALAGMPTMKRERRK
jgi:hypothetical protein